MTYAKYFAAFFVGIIAISSPTALFAADDPPASGEGAAPDPAAATAFQFKNEGILGCTTNVGQSVGAMAAIGGVYVPVNDAAVTVNTGLLVYKFCVLDPMTRKIAENATADLAKGALQSVTQGRSGRSQFVQNPSAELAERGNSGALSGLMAIKDSDARFGGSDKDKSKIVQVLAKRFTTDTSWDKRLEAAACPYDDTEDTPFFESLAHSADPRCSAYFSAELYLGPLTDARAAALQNDLKMQWDWGPGTYPIEEVDGDKFTTVTPSYIVSQNALQAIQSGFRQAENVDAMGQMTTALFSGLAQQVLADSKGLKGITQSSGSQPSYLNQLTAETAADVRSAASNAALQVLANARQVEAKYLQLMNSIANTLTSTINKLRNAESQCYALLIPKVQAYAANQNCTTGESGTPTCTGGFQIQPATSTALSQGIIGDQIQPLATNAINNINTSSKAVSLIDQMIAGVTTVSSLSAQRLALQQLDTLVSQKALHSQYDLTAAQQQEAAVKDAMATLVTDTTNAWTQSPDPNIGWCNYNNTAVLQFWANRWRK